LLNFISNPNFSLFGIWKLYSMSLPMWIFDHAVDWSLYFSSLFFNPNFADLSIAWHHSKTSSTTCYRKLFYRMIVYCKYTCRRLIWSRILISFGPIDPDWKVPNHSFISSSAILNLGYAYPYGYVSRRSGYAKLYVK
jgi:hypothetical protein